MAYPDCFAHQSCNYVLISIHATLGISSILRINAKDARTLAEEITAICDQIEKIEQKQAESA